MLKLTCFLAAVATGDPMDAPTLEGEASKLFGYNVRDIMILGGMVLVLAIALFLFAYLTKKNRRVTISPAGSRAIYRADERDDDRRRRKKRRRHNHPEFLPRNPTLQETGGLPPLRPEEPAEPTQ